MNSFIVQEKHKYTRNNSNYKPNGLGGNMHKVGLNAGDTQTLHECLGGNSVLVHMSLGNLKPLRRIKSGANIDSWSVSQTLSRI